MYNVPPKIWRFKLRIVGELCQSSSCSRFKVAKVSAVPDKKENLSCKLIQRVGRSKILQNEKSVSPLTDFWNRSLILQRLGVSTAGARPSDFSRAL
jgi:hypothetical protein